MIYDVKLMALERKTYLSYHQDGLIDLAFGLAVIAYGTGLYSGMVAVFGGAFFVIWLLYLSAKRVITSPRFGYFEVGSYRKLMMKRFLIAALLLNVASVAVGLIVIGKLQAGAPELRELLARYIHYYLGGLGLLATGGIAFVTGVVRLWGYVVLGALSLVVSNTLAMDPVRPYLFTGVVALVVGLGLLFSFVRRYPVAEEKDDADEA